MVERLRAAMEAWRQIPEDLRVRPRMVKSGTGWTVWLLHDETGMSASARSGMRQDDARALYDRQRSLEGAWENGIPDPMAEEYDG